jgi:uncharacterized caspase-like protein
MPLLYRIIALVLALAPLFAAPAGAQAPERRFALVIGNSEYKAGRHPTAANDAGLVAETLRSAGFDVAGARALDQETLRRSAREFLDKVSAAGPQAVAFIYLAGYGVQFEGENYIVPVDATIARDEDIPIEAVRISDITRPLSGAPGGVKLVIIDAARQHPYSPAGTPLASGLALVDPDPATLVAFNTAPGSVAPIENGPYGAFAQALSEMIATGGLSLDDVFARVRLRVNEKTNGVAVPWYASKVTQAFLFTERTPEAPATPQQVVTTMELQSTPIQQFQGDQDAYIAALERDTIAGYEEFIAAFPDSPHVRRVRALIAVRREAILWRRVLSINTQEAYWSYLERYPQGAHVADCERRLARLAAAYDPPPAFVPMEFADVPPPPPDEVVYLNQPVIEFSDPVFAPPPPVPVFFCPPAPPEFVDLPPPPPPIGAFFLPAPAVPFFDGPRPWVRPPEFVTPPPRPPIQRLTIDNTTVVNERPGGGVGLLSPAPSLPGAVVNRVNTGVLRVPPPAPPAPPVPPLRPASPHPGVGVLGTTVALPPRVHAATLPGGLPQQGPASPIAPRLPALPGVPPRQPGPNTATTTPGLPPQGPGQVVPGPGRPGRPGTPPRITRPEQQPRIMQPEPRTPPPSPSPQIARPEPPPPQATRPELPPSRVTRPEPAPSPRVARPEPPPPRATRPEPPPSPRVVRPEPPPAQAPHPASPAPQVAHPAPPPPQAARPAPPPSPPQIARPAPPPPQAARPAPPPQIARPAPPPPPPPHPAPPPPQVARPAPPPPAARPAPPPAAAHRCTVENGKQVCR